MRFVTLALERYGHFDDCRLSFRSGEPDLHVVYGANEAGKTTSMAAVSDLLFGFLGRSPYNFLYDYSLLRVGAVLEDAGQTMSCRRKKAPNGSLLGPDDKPIDEGPLLAMLRGQTRETFGLSFSLNQEGLRAGGKAMVEARNDNGSASTKAKAREGKKAIVGYFSEDMSRQLRMLAVEEDTTVQALVGEALDMLLRARDKHPFGER